MNCARKFLRLRWVGPLLLCGEEIARIPEGVAGVYLLHAFATNVGAYPVFYAGKSGSLRRRLDDHTGNGSTKPCIRKIRLGARSYFSAAPVKDLEHLDGVEAALIRMLRPVCNDQIPTAPPVAVTLPPMFVQPFTIAGGCDQ